MDFNAKFFDHLQFPVDVLGVRTVGWDLAVDETSTVSAFLINMNVIVAESAEEGRT